MPERLQKILAEGGIGSRRECETMIQDGRVEVDREIVTKLGTKVDPETQLIRVDGEVLKLAAKKYFAVNKPRGVISTNNDPSGRLRVIDLIGTDQHVYTVGRLDKDSEGLIIVTNDGALANQLTHPKYGIEKTYLIQVEGHPTREQMESLVSGVYLAEGLVQIKAFQFKRKQKNTTEIEIVLDEGKNREVRRLLAKIGHKVLFLRRTAVGSFVLEGIPFGGHRQLTADEVALLSQNPKRRKRQSAAPKKKQHVGKLKSSSRSDDQAPAAARRKTRDAAGTSRTRTSRKKSAGGAAGKRSGNRKTVHSKSAKKPTGKTTGKTTGKRKKTATKKSSGKSAPKGQKSLGRKKSAGKRGLAKTTGKAGRKKRGKR